MPDPWFERLAYPGARDYGQLRAFFERFDFGSLEPRQYLVVEASDLVRVAALPSDDVLVVYAIEAVDITLEEDTTDGTECAWVHPGSWNRVPTKIEGGDNGTVVAPPWNGDALLICHRYEGGRR